MPVGTDGYFLSDLFSAILTTDEFRFEWKELIKVFWRVAGIDVRVGFGENEANSILNQQISSLAWRGTPIAVHVTRRKNNSATAARHKSISAKDNRPTRHPVDSLHKPLCRPASVRQPNLGFESVCFHAISGAQI
jgi:hypothetical protein